jgi:hypothetical protein
LGTTAEREKKIYQWKLKSCRKEELNWNQGARCNDVTVEIALQINL